MPTASDLTARLDSSAIAALCARDRSSRRHFLGGVRGSALSELEYARAVARAIGANAHEIVIDDRDFFAALPRLVWHEDEPIAHPSSVPLHFDSVLARQHVVVVLTGEERRAARGLRQISARGHQRRAARCRQRLVPAAVRASVAGSLVPRLPGRAALRAPIVPGDAAQRLGDVPRQLRRHAGAPASANCSRPRPLPVAMLPVVARLRQRGQRPEPGSSDACCTRS